MPLLSAEDTTVLVGIAVVTIAWVMGCETLRTRLGG